MNERFEKLADEAKLTAVYEMFETELGKFAELIVRECALTAALMEHGGRENIGAALLDSFEIPINSNVMEGADQMAGDGGYQISTKEAYEAFVKKRNGE